MRICPDCNNEYDEKEDSCPACAKKKTAGKLKNVDWVPVTTVANDIEFQMVAGLLEMGGIPVVRDAISIEGFILGLPVAGIEVKVPADRLEEAAAILDAKFDEEELGEE